MAKCKYITIFILAGVLSSAHFAYANGAAAKAPAIDPKAEQVIRQMSDYIISLPSFSVHLDAVVEGVMGSGERLDTDRSVDIWVERPNKLRANIISAKHNVQIYYDGATFTIFSPKQNYYGLWDAPGSIEETVAAARAKYGLALPSADFLASDPYQKLMAKVTSGTHVNDVSIRGTATHHLAFRQPDIDWQIWIEADDTPLPLRIIITDKQAPGEPQYMASFSDWNTSPSIDSGTFAFVVPDGAQKIDVKSLPIAKKNVAPAKSLQNGGSK